MTTVLLDPSSEAVPAERVRAARHRREGDAHDVRVQVGGERAVERAPIEHRGQQHLRAALQHAHSLPASLLDSGPVSPRCFAIREGDECRICVCVQV